MKVDGFDWDNGNIEKCQKHGLDIRLIEDVFALNPLVVPDESYSQKEPRFIALGAYGDKWVFVAFTIRAIEGKMFYRVISARFAREKEVRKIYEKIKKK
jgi:hypothetical protein